MKNSETTGHGAAHEAHRLHGLNRQRTRDLTALLGIFAGLGLLFPAFLMPGMSALTIPALLLLLPALVYELR